MIGPSTADNGRYVRPPKGTARLALSRGPSATRVVYLHAAERAAVPRGVARDAVALGGVDAARDAYEARNMAACRIYLHERRPRDRATIVVDNTDPVRPVLERTPAR